MNNSRTNACSPWKCKQSATRTARWTGNLPKNERIFAFFISIIINIINIIIILLLPPPNLYFNEVGVM